jgi:uncharacterized protein YlaI
MSGICKRKLKRTAFCRGCDDEMETGTEVISMYSFRNRGQHIYLCMTCSKLIGELVKEENSNEV